MKLCCKTQSNLACLGIYWLIYFLPCYFQTLFQTHLMKKGGTVLKISLMLGFSTWKNCCKPWGHYLKIIASKLIEYFQRGILVWMALLIRCVLFYCRGEKILLNYADLFNERWGMLYYVKWKFGGEQRNIDVLIVSNNNLRNKKSFSVINQKQRKLQNYVELI